LMRKVFLLALVFLLVGIGGTYILPRSQLSKGFLREAPEALKDRIWNLLDPIARMLAEVRFRLDRGFKTYIFLVSAQKENRELRRSSAIMQFQLRHLRVLEEENERLRNLLGFQQTSPLRLIPCQITGIEVELWRRVFWISKGTKDGVNEGAPVVTPKGIAGRIVHASPSTACFLPITSEKITLDGALAKNGVQGLVQGNGFDLINFLYIPKESGILPGDAVVSTGLEGVFPQGLPIGTVTEVRTEKSGLFFRATIKPSSPPFGLREAFVVSLGQ